MDLISQNGWMSITSMLLMITSLGEQKKPMGRSKSIEQRSDVAHAITPEGHILLFGGLVDTNKSCSEMIQLDISKIY